MRLPAWREEGNSNPRPAQIRDSATDIKAETNDHKDDGDEKDDDDDERDDGDTVFGIA